MKVIFITNIPSPYRVNFFNELGKLVNLKVLFERKFASDRNKSWHSFNFKNFKHSFILALPISSDKSFSPFLFLHFLFNKYDHIIVSGYSSPTIIILILMFRIFKIKFIITSDGAFINFKESRFLFNLKRFLISSGSYYFSPGKFTDNQLIYYGAKKTKIYRYPFTSLLKKDIIDLSEFNSRNKSFDKNNFKIVSIGQIIHRKGFDILLKVASYHKNISFFIIGGAPTEDLKLLINQFKLNNVYFLPFMTKIELLKFLDNSHCFILLTREDVWGLVVNEAMARGLPVISTNRCGSAIELITIQENGFIYDFNNIQSLNEFIFEISTNKSLYSKISINNIHKISSYSIENMAKIIYDSLSIMNNRINL